tara:strand:- start:743 stop:1216 length:474 start_codon:yes stop_codon:yes gene_type:complete
MFRFALVVLLFCCPLKADAFGIGDPDFQNSIFAGARISYQKDLGFGLGLHSSYWVIGDARIADVLPYSATAGAGWYQRGRVQYLGLQAGNFVGVSAGIFAQQGRSGSFTGRYYDLWGAWFGGVSIRQMMKWGEGLQQTPVDLSLFGSLPVVFNGQLR